jgi:hypothetical protein
MSSPPRSRDPRVVWENITPKKAQALIDKHNEICEKTGKANYRPRSNPKEADFAGQMTAGNWTPGWDAIAIGSDGLILNGQTRLHAVLDSGTTQRMMVTYDFPEEAVDTGDRNRNRTNGDHYRHQGKKYYKELASAAIMLYHYETNTLHMYNAPPGGVAVLDEVLSRHDGIEEAVAKAQTEWRTANPILSLTIVAVLYHLFSSYSEEDANDFFTGLMTGTNSGRALMNPGNPVWRLRNQLQAQKSDPVKYERAGEVYKVMLCWNDFRTNKKRSHAYSAIGAAAPGGKPKALWLDKGWPTLL